MNTRQDYVEKLLSYLNVPLIKILAGIRRCGKSTILEMFKDELLQRAIKPDHIIHISYTEFEHQLDSAKEMYTEIKKLMHDSDKYYLLLDEVQEIPDWEKTINALLEEKNTDIYVTGSNSKLMSSEISTYLTGRYVSIPVFTLSFKEYIDFKKAENKTTTELFNDFIRFGGFPLIASNIYDEQTAYQIVQDIFSSVVMNDIAKRHIIKNIDMFRRVTSFVIENTGKTFSANNIANFLKNEGRSISVEAVYNYLEWLEKAFVIYRCSRYDLQGKAVLKTQEKFYIADTSLKYALFGYNPMSIAAMLENLVYFHLKRNNYTVYIGKLGDKEIDFVATKASEKIYIQVCKEMPQNSEREIKNLLVIKDNYPKIILTLDPFAVGTVDGVQIINLIDFLLSN